MNFLCGFEFWIDAKCKYCSSKFNHIVHLIVYLAAGKWFDTVTRVFNNRSLSKRSTSSERISKQKQVPMFFTSNYFDKYFWSRRVDTREFWRIQLFRSVRKLFKTDFRKKKTLTMLLVVAELNPSAMWINILCTKLKSYRAFFSRGRIIVRWALGNCLLSKIWNVTQKYFSCDDTQFPIDLTTSLNSSIVVFTLSIQRSLLLQISFHAR